MSSSAPTTTTTAVTRGRRLSKGQTSASITILPKSAHSFDDTIQIVQLSNKPEGGIATAPGPHNMQRQDSGYESLISTKSAKARKLSADSGVQPRALGSKAISRSPTTGSTTNRLSTAASASSSAYAAQSRTTPHTTLFQFPEPDIAVPESEDAVAIRPPMPPPTTHYWTSDHTRRLEYAAIDAARRGVRGWIRRNLVPDCMAPKDGGHLDFDDDTGSVRRYRLELDDADMAHVAEEKSRRSKWFPWARKAAA
ncbi:hypothetical protein jhhlp_002685 [Lomentospora prolificans]|uniref:Uncharacterized protein n=1 Tax=Lomentospora prolificans TaxID=41688 RepID=A0A2N3NEW1_9PEZI|nr:hypothetical protein jhhlp_002685 [Lomentospora prolificans]